MFATNALWPCPIFEENGCPPTSRFMDGAFAGVLFQHFPDNWNSYVMGVAEWFGGSEWDRNITATVHNKCLLQWTFWATEQDRFLKSNSLVHRAYSKWSFTVKLHCIVEPLGSGRNKPYAPYAGQFTQARFAQVKHDCRLAVSSRKYVLSITDFSDSTEIAQSSE